MTFAAAIFSAFSPDIRNRAPTRSASVCVILKKTSSSKRAPSIGACKVAPDGLKRHSTVYDSGLNLWCNRRDSKLRRLRGVRAARRNPELREGPSNFRKTCLEMVPSKGLEPPHRCRYMDLNHARLPIPPRWQSDLQCSGGPKAAVSGRSTLLFYRHVTDCQTTFATEQHPLSELRRHGDFRVQDFRYRTAFLRRLRIFLKRRRVRARNLAYDIEVARCNRPSRI